MFPAVPGGSAGPEEPCPCPPGKGPWLALGATRDYPAFFSHSPAQGVIAGPGRCVPALGASETGQGPVSSDPAGAHAHAPFEQAESLAL